MAEGKVRNKTQVMASPKTGEITANRAGDSAVLQSFDRWLSDRFPAARTAWIRCSSLKLQIGTNLDRNGGRKWNNRPGRARGRVGSGSVSPLSLFSSLFPFSLSVNLYGWSTGSKPGVGYYSIVIEPRTSMYFRMKILYNRKY
ncbi:hypothetical protein AB3S75_045400 [Citrus x aurantiifolia]